MSYKDSVRILSKCFRNLSGFLGILDSFAVFSASSKDRRTFLAAVGGVTRIMSGFFQDSVESSQDSPGLVRILCWDPKFLISSSGFSVRFPQSCRIPPDSNRLPGFSWILQNFLLFLNVDIPNYQDS